LIKDFPAPSLLFYSGSIEKGKYWHKKEGVKQWFFLCVFATLERF
jgi:hypothetical protein